MCLLYNCKNVLNSAARDELVESECVGRILIPLSICAVVLFQHASLKFIKKWQSPLKILQIKYLQKLFRGLGLRRVTMAQIWRANAFFACKKLNNKSTYCVPFCVSSPL